MVITVLLWWRSGRRFGIESRLGRGVCNRLALAVPVPSWSRRLKKASARIAEGQSIAKALSGSGVLKRKESATLALCRDAESLAWAMRELSHSLLQRTLNRTHIAIQLLTEG